MNAIIFDLDGVVANTGDAHFRSWDRLAREQNIPFSRKDFRPMLGRSRKDSLDILTGGVPLASETSDAWLDRKQHYFLEELARLRPGDILPGVVALIDQAEDQGVSIGLASSSRNARAVLAQLGIIDRFRTIADGNTSVPPKPAPDIFLYVAEALGAKPRDTVVLEDSEAGLQAAIRGGFRVVTTGPVAISAVHCETLEGLSLATLFATAGHRLRAA